MCVNGLYEWTFSAALQKFPDHIACRGARINHAATPRRSIFRHQSCDSDIYAPLLRWGRHPLEQFVGLHHRLKAPGWIESPNPFPNLRHPLFGDCVSQAFAGLAVTDDGDGQETSGRFSGRDLQSPLPRACLSREHDAVGDAGTWRFFAAVIEQGQPARIGLELFLGIEADADADRDQGPEATVDAGAERDPFAFSFGVHWRCE